MSLLQALTDWSLTLLNVSKLGEILAILETQSERVVKIELPLTVALPLTKQDEKKKNSSCYNTSHSGFGGDTRPSSRITHMLFSRRCNVKGAELEKLMRRLFQHSAGRAGVTFVA